jgi:hypothetical protein
MMHNNEPTNAEIRSSNVILISPRPKSMRNSRNKSPPTNAKHPNTHVGPEPEASFGKSYKAAGERSGQRSDNQPDNEFANGHD